VCALALRLSQTGAHVGIGIDDRGEPVALGDFAGKVVIHVEDLRAGFEGLQHALTILVEADVEGCDSIAGCNLGFCDQRDVALDARDERALQGLGIAKLRERADAVRISVEDIDLCHEIS
jgi:hypothetical protein